MKPRIMYIESEAELNGRGRIGRVSFSKSGATIYYDGKEFRSLKGGYKANYCDVATKDPYWISGPKKAGGDRLYGQPGVPIDEDVREGYWTQIRKLPQNVRDKTA